MEASLEERLAFVEARVDEHSKAFEEIKGLILNLDQKFDRRIDTFEQRVDRRFEAIERRIDSLDQRLSGRIDSLDQKFSRYFLWIIGIQVSIFLAIIATLLK